MKYPNKEYYRVIDANLNRLREGLRVIEDILRYVYNNKKISSKLKDLRHKCRVKENFLMLEARDINGDCLKKSIKSESTREDIKDILISNFKRVQESCRTLEEFTKIVSNKQSQMFKDIRYEAYDIEKVLLYLQDISPSTNNTSNSK